MTLEARVDLDSTMLSDNELREAVESGYVKLLYHFHPSNIGRCWSNTGSTFVHDDPAAQALFESQITRSRIGLHLGPLLQPLGATRRSARRGQRFGRHKGIVDLLESGDGGWLLSPGASAVAFTLEWLELPPDVDGLVISRVGDYNTGLVVASSYIDSTWRGLTKVHITNNGRQAVPLYVGLELARLFLFKTCNPSRDDHGVSKDAGHYEKKWSEILAAPELDPFTQSNVPRVRFSMAAVRNANEIAKNYSGYGLALLALIGGAAFLRAYNSFDSIQEVRRDVQDLRVESPQSGRVTLSLEPGQLAAARTVELPAGLRYRGSESIVLTNIAPGGEAESSGRLDFAGDGVGLVIEVAANAAAQQPRSFLIEFLVIP